MLKTYGSVSYDEKKRKWTLDLVPHVSLRFKQTFTGVQMSRIPPFVLTDRPDLAVDLQWFFERYPVRMDDATRRSMRRLAQMHVKNVAKCENIVSGDWTPPAVQGFRDGESPFPFQQKAAALCHATSRLLLLDDVGLGKTVSSLALLTMADTLPAIVVVQSHLSEQWVEEYIEAFTHLRAHAVTTRKPYDLPVADIYVFRYSNICGWVDFFPKIGYRTVVFDEIQELRTGTTTDKGSAAKIISERAAYRIGLTATPIYNYGSEIFQIVEIIAPGALGTWNDFLTEWCTMKGNHWVVKDPDALGAYLMDQHITLRRDENHPEVAKQMPPPNRVAIEVGWNTKDVEDDQALKRDLASRVLGGSFKIAGQAALELDLLMRHETGVAKARSVAAYVRMLVEAGQPVLLAGWHRDVYSIWNECLSDLDPVMYTGSESTKKKAKAKLDFIEGRSKLMFISLRSGAGLDGLQHVASDVVFGEFDWSPQVHKQVVGRLRRWGQTKQVTAHFLHVNGGSDPMLIEVLGLKSSQSQGIVDPYSDVQVVEFDESRMRRLARQVLGLSDEGDRIAA